MSDQIGPYRIRRVIGQGGMGVVYEAEEALSGRRVALKTLAPERARDERARTLFRNEIQFLAHLDHPNLVRSLAAQEIDGQMVLVMEFLQGKTLREVLIEGGRLPWTEAAELVATLASALGALHQAEPPILHRDLKPENVLLLADGRLKLLDLGIAKAYSAEETTSTQGLGTLLYMSPEQIDGKPLDPRSDLYSLGLLLFELLTGHPPFQSSSPRELMDQQCTAQPVLDPEVRRELPRGIEQLLLRMLAKAASERPASARDVIDGLEAFLPTGGVAPVSTPGPRSGVVRTSLASAIPTSTSIPSTAPSPRPSLLEREVATPLAVVVLVVVSLLAALIAVGLRLAS